MPTGRDASATPASPAPPGAIAGGEEGPGNAALSVRRIAEPEEVDRLRLSDLSDWFNPFLEHFMLESLRCGGEVAVAEESGIVRGIYLYSPAERIASVFSRSRALAEELARRRDDLSVYTPFPMTPGAERFTIYSIATDRWNDPGRFSHPLRIAGATDRPRIARFMREVYGVVDERWIATMPDAAERCFLVEVGGEIVGAAWASLVGGHGRLHSLTVRPSFRRLGIGSELFRARMLWLRAAGAGPVVSEISERNLPSRTVAEHGGMVPAGSIFRHERASPPLPASGKGP